MVTDVCVCVCVGRWGERVRTKWVKKGFFEYSSVYFLLFELYDSTTYSIYRQLEKEVENLCCCGDVCSCYKRQSLKYCFLGILGLN